METTEKRILKENWYKLAYVFVAIYYLFKLDNLNKELLIYPTNNVFEKLSYRNGAAIEYFILALALGTAGALIIINTCKKILEGLKTVIELVISLLAIVCILILIGVIIHFIMVPIVRLIISAIVAIVAGIYWLVS